MDKERQTQIARLLLLGSFVTGPLAGCILGFFLPEPISTGGALKNFFTIVLVAAGMSLSLFLTGIGLGIHASTQSWFQAMIAVLVVVMIMGVTISIAALTN